MSSNNLVVLRGTILSDATERRLPSGATVVQFDVRTEGDDREPTATVPVSWSSAPAGQVTTLNPGTEVVVVGSVNRRFFRVNGATQSRTEVIAHEVVPARRTASARRAVERALLTISSGDGSRGRSSASG